MFVFFASFLLYLVTLFPGVAPYRDTGEMVSVAHTLGIAHPPGYPLYTLISKAFLLLVPFGNEGYRLNVLSALAGAGTIYFVYLIFRRLSMGKTFASLASMLLATSYLQWYLALVSEMYTLNTLFAALLLLLLVCIADGKAEDAAQRSGYVYLAVFLFGLGLGNRMDLLLLFPAFLVVGWQQRRLLTFRLLAGAAGIFLLGFSVFAYLPFRSGAGPLLDWNHPANLERLWGSLTRKTHGGTLDLISQAYAPGENFGVTLRFYGEHLLQGFAYAGLPLAALGLYALWKRRRVLAVASAAAWVLCGPVFIYLSNMPPNTHALAILEAHFLLPNVIVALWAGMGLLTLFRDNGSLLRTAAPAAAGCLVAVNLALHYPELDKRGNLVAYDYAKNVLRSAPPRSVLVMKKDVQLFALWNQQLVEGRRPDVTLVSQGLAGSPWYAKPFARRHPGVFIGALRSADDWKVFADANRGQNVYMSGDAEYYRPSGYGEEQNGLLSLIVQGKESARGEVLLDTIYPYRGAYRAGAYREFFTPDLIESYAKACVDLGQYYLRTGAIERGRGYLRRSLKMKDLLPVAQTSIAYSYITEGNYAAAREQYELAVGQYERYLALAMRYRALPDVRATIARDFSEAYIALGVCSEKTGNEQEALQYYSAAIATYSRAARAYFNRAVVNWKRSDWSSVVRDLEQAVGIDPQFQEAAFYLAQARQRIR